MIRTLFDFSYWWMSIESDWNWLLRWTDSLKTSWFNYYLHIWLFLQNLAILNNSAFQNYKQFHKYVKWYFPMANVGYSTSPFLHTHTHTYHSSPVFTVVDSVWNVCLHHFDKELHLISCFIKNSNKMRLVTNLFYVFSPFEQPEQT